MNAIITTKKPENLPDKFISAHADAVKSTSTSEIYKAAPAGDAKYSVALMDYGAKNSIIKNLTELGCGVTVYPYNTPAEQVLSGGYDGIVLSNGPGDPPENEFCIQQIKKMLGKLPMVGICLGHQMMALAAGGKTEKMKFGHRGSSFPVKNLKTGRIYITSQNHGYAVDPSSLPEGTAYVHYVNINDSTCEGIDYPGLNAYSVQFYPSAHIGPKNSENIFDRFIKMMEDK